MEKKIEMIKSSTSRGDRAGKTIDVACQNKTLFLYFLDMSLHAYKKLLQQFSSDYLYTLSI